MAGSDDCVGVEEGQVTSQFINAIKLVRCWIANWLMVGIGGDERGQFVRRELSPKGMQTDLVTVLQYPTDLSLIYTDAQGEKNCKALAEVCEAFALPSGASIMHIRRRLLIAKRRSYNPAGRIIEHAVIANRSDRSDRSDRYRFTLEMTGARQ